LTAKQYGFKFIIKGSGPLTPLFSAS